MAFVGKTVLVTGAANGLGLETAKRFAKEGAELILLDKDVAKLEDARAQIPNCTTVVADLLDWETSRTALKSVGHVDHLVNNAGVAAFASFLKTTPDMIDFIFGVNFKSMVNVSQVICEKMIASGKPCTIVNISSLASKTILPDLSMYCASKAAVTMLTRSMAKELGPNIRVNAVCPTYMITALTQAIVEENPEHFDAMFQRAPIGRFLTAEETADSIIFLSSSASSMITGSSIDIDGGYASARY